MIKTAKSILSFVIIASMILSLGAVSISADSVARNATIALSANSGEEGDTVKVDVSIENTEGIASIGYTLSFDPNVFEISSGIYQDIMDDEGWEVPQVVDRAWADYYLGLSGGKKWSSFLFGVNAANGTITVGAIRGTGITAANNIDNMVVGSFNLTVKEGATVGETSITLNNAETADAGQSLGAAMIFTPVTFTVLGEPEPTEEYTVTFDLNYEGAPEATTAETEGGVVARPGDPTREGYTFEGWFEDAEGTTEYNFDTVLDADKILYAKWTPAVEYTITFMADGNEVATRTVVSGGTLTDIPPVPAKSGHTGAWDTVDFTNITDDMTVEAIYTPVEGSVPRNVTLTLSADSGEAGDTVKVDVSIGNTLDIASIGYTLSFDPNVFEISSGIYQDIMDDEGWEVPQVVDRAWADYYLGLSGGKKWSSFLFGVNAANGTITVGAIRGTGITAANNIDNMVVGSFNLTVKEGATVGETSITLNNAETADAGQSLGAAMIFTPVTFTVLGEPEPTEEYTVTFDLNYEGAPEATTAETEGGVVARPEDPTRDGYTFEGWFEDAEGTTEYNFDTVLDADKTLYAKWTPVQVEYTVTFDLNYEGAPEATTAETEGGVVARPDDPTRDGYTFEGWYEDEEGTVLFNFSTELDADKTLYAKWSPVFVGPALVFGQPSTTEIFEGATFTLEVKAQEIPANVEAIQFGVSYDGDIFEQVTAQDVVKGANPAISYFEVSPAAGEFGVALTIDADTTLDDGEVIAVITFRVKSGIKNVTATVQIFDAEYGFGTPEGTTPIENMGSRDIGITEPTNPNYLAALEAINDGEFGLEELDTIGVEIGEGNEGKLDTYRLAIRTVKELLGRDLVKTDIQDAIDAANEISDDELGNLDEIGDISANDAAMIIQVCLHRYTFNFGEDLTNAEIFAYIIKSDVNRDGEINAYDISFVLLEAASNIVAQD
ncbi:MAG: Internalin-A precursor [Firmicutes bacterium ADurb.Bin193]|nr:MAG: Internalin-A precursor [Firmicutes bacterium ADurb.Bin193]